MTAVIRHGGEAHVVRPDRVYRTSVIVPFVNYQPQADVQAVAQQFTTGGPMATQLSGYGFSGPNFFQRIAIRFKAARAAKQAARFMAVSGYGFAGDGRGSPGPDIVVGSQVAPQMQSQMAFLERMVEAHNPGHVRQAIAQAHRSLTWRRPFTYYRAG